jgi:hypothetical protein
LAATPSGQCALAPATFWDHADVNDPRQAVGFTPAAALKDGALRFVEWYRNFIKGSPAEKGKRSSTPKGTKHGRLRHPEKKGNAVHFSRPMAKDTRFRPAQW